MKPIKLTLCGWGPYKEKQEIDFRDLQERGLFLITGATGAGKTTVFDAITYALYGNMSGDTREKIGVRSDFATAQTPTYVELLMEHEGREYHIYRNPEYMRPRKRKTNKANAQEGMQQGIPTDVPEDVQQGRQADAEASKEILTKEKERAVLTLPNGEVTEGTTEVNRAIQKLLRLDYRQFKQLSMIAQGEFARFLTAGSGEKTRIFRELFGTEVYEKVAAMLKTGSAGMYKQIMEYRHKMDENIAMYVPDPEAEETWQVLTQSGTYYYEAVLAFLEKEREKMKICKSESQKLCKEKEEAVQKTAGELAEAEQIQGLYEKLKSELEKQKQLAGKAGEFKEKEALLKRQQSALMIRPYEIQYHMSKEQVMKAEEDLQQAETAIAQIAGWIEAQTPIYEKREEIQQIYALVYKKKEMTGMVNEEQVKAAKRKEELCKLQEVYLQAEKEETHVKQAYEQAEKSYRFGLAGILAETLSEGEACPVCGSLHHPMPALKDAKAPSKEQIKEKREAYEEKQKIRMELHGKTVACMEQLRVTEETAQKLQEEVLSFEQELRKKDRAILGYVNQCGETEYKEWQKKYEQQAVLLKEKEKQRESLKETIKTTGQKSKKLKADFDKQCEAAGFLQPQDYKDSLAEEAVSRRLEEEIRQYHLECHANTELIVHLKGEINKKSCPDVSEIKKRLDILVKEREVLVKQHNLRENFYIQTKRIWETLEEKKEQLDRLMERYSLLRDLDDAANGNNSKRLVFEQYVLASYFEEILHAANLRLRTMSSGRYELRRMAGVSDGRSKDNLEIEVMDYYTGKYRSVKTLSGGESFKASLSLALGMSDVVQAFSGGIRVETLFIDEGFGSLDSESLEHAHQTLQSLVEKDRLIGIISHVSELSEKISGQIRVHKTNAGSTLEVVVF